MAQVKYQFIADPGISMKELVFESAIEAGPGKNTTTLEVAITNLLDVDFSCSGTRDNKPGDDWYLYIWVDNRPIQTTSMTGCISGKLDKKKKARFSGAFNW